MPSAARANGRFPEASALVVDPATPTHLVARTTFGLLRSFDRGSTWSWICEQAISATGLLDEELFLGTAGRTSVALSDGIAVDDGQGCTWSRLSGDLAGRQVVDVVVQAGDPKIAYAAVGVKVDGAQHGRIAKTVDGQTWSFIGQLLQSTFPVTIDVSRSHPERLYLGVNDGNFEFGFIDSSDDGGETWTRHAPPNGIDSVYVSGIDPADPDRVYVRATFPSNTLYASADAAVTWTAVHTAQQPLLGFAISPDGQKVALGGADGLVILGRSADTFSVLRTNPLSIKCLTWTAAGLYACADDTADGFAIGLSTDEGATFASLLKLRDLVPGWCPAETSVARACGPAWCPLATAIGADCAAAVKPTSANAGCRCSVTDTFPPGPWSVAATAVALLLFRRRRSSCHTLSQDLTDHEISHVC